MKSKDVHAFYRRIASPPARGRELKYVAEHGLQRRVESPPARGRELKCGAGWACEAASSAPIWAAGRYPLCAGY